MKKIKYFNLIFSIFLSTSINLKLLIDHNLDTFIKKFHINFIFIVKILLLAILIYFILELLFYLLDKIPLKNKKLVLNKKQIIAIFICVFTTSMLFLIAHYPAVYLNDTLFYVYGPTTRGGPIIYACSLSAIYKILDLMLSKTMVVFIMSIGQAIISSIILTYVIVWFNDKLKNKILTIILIIYYVFTPIISNYNVALNKDTPFTLLVLLFFILICEIVESKGKILSNKEKIMLLFPISFLLICVRLNSMPLIILTMLSIFIIYGIKKYKKECAVFIIVIVIFSFIPTLILKISNGEELKREIYTIPIQQVCYLVKYHPETLSKKDYNVLSKFINNPKKTISENYNVFEVDKIKYNEEFDPMKFNKYYKEFLVIWINKFPKNIPSYTKSYLLNTYHLWSINKLEKTQSIFRVASLATIENKEYGVTNKRVLPESIQNILMYIYQRCDVYLNSAGCFILLLIINLYAYYRKRREVIILSIPLLALWITLMLGTPLSAGLRYMAPYLYILPILGLYTFKVTRKDKKHE